MRFLMIVKARIDRPFTHWATAFDAEDGVRRGAGVECLFRHPVVGEQAVVFGMLVDDPRPVHDMMYDDRVRPGIEASGLVIGSETITVCEAVD